MLDQADAKGSLAERVAFAQQAKEKEFQEPGAGLSKGIVTLGLLVWLFKDCPQSQFRCRFGT